MDENKFLVEADERRIRTSKWIGVKRFNPFLARSFDFSGYACAQDLNDFGEYASAQDLC